MTVADEIVEAEVEELEGQTGSELARIDQERSTAVQPATVLPTAREWEATMAVAKEIAGTKFVPEAYRGEPEAVVAAILTGRELGIGPMQALRDIHMIDGRAAFSANLMLSLMRRGGLEILRSEISDERAWIHARRRDTGEEAEVEWRYEEATKIMRGNKALSEGAGWKNYRQDMLWARCVGRLARRLGSDLLGGMVYASEEVQDWEEDSGGGYGSGGGYEATTLDPGRQLLPGAIAVKTQDDAVAIRKAQHELDPTQNWDQIEEACATHIFGKGRNEMNKVQTGEFWKRLANAVVKVNDLGGGGDFPPPTLEQIAEGYAWAFNGAVFVLRLPDAGKEEE